MRLMAASLALAAQVVAGSALAADASSLILARAGNLPILLTAPHGGLQGVPEVPVRSRGTTLTDAHTIELAEAVSKHLGKALGAEPYLVAARFSRKYIDANRAEEDAFDSPQAKPVYDAYHGQIRQFIAQIKERFPQGGLLLDIHGQADDPGTLHRGTRNGTTVAALVRKHGSDALGGPQSVLGVVQARGYKVFPPNALGDPQEERRYNGGYTVHTYGSRSPHGLDAIQIEVGRDLRRDAGFIAALAEGITVFYRTYLER
jgi:N-formylglutamate amidohydrolase